METEIKINNKNVPGLMDLIREAMTENEVRKLVANGKENYLNVSPKTVRKWDTLAKKRIEEILNFVGLWDMRNEYAVKLSYGNQRRVEIARALATNPQLLLLDEPTAGMNQKETNELMELFSQVNKEGITILIIAHDMHLVNTLSDQITVINFGEKLVEGPPELIQSHPAVIEAYMGRAEANA